MLAALAHAQLLHRHGAGNAGGDLAGRLERGVQAVKQAYSQCPSWEELVPALLNHPIEVPAACLLEPRRESAMIVQGRFDAMRAFQAACRRHLNANQCVCMLFGPETYLEAACATANCVPPLRDLTGVATLECHNSGTMSTST